MPGQSGSRPHVNPDDLFLAFDSEEPGSVVNGNEPDPALDRKEPDPVFDPTEVDSAFDRKAPEPVFDPRELDIAFNPKELDIASERKEPDIQPHIHELPVHRTSDTPFVMHQAVPVVPQTRRWNIGIALLVIGGIGLVWSGRLLLGRSSNPGASATPAQTASQPPRDVPQAAPNVSPPASAPQPPAREDAPPAITAPPAHAATTATATPRDERLVGEAAPRPAAVKPNGPGGLFAITRPVGAQVFLDDMLVGTTPLFMTRLSPGSHHVRLELAGFKTYSSTIQVEPNERFRLALQLEEVAR